MKLPNWFKIGWWIFLLVVITRFLVQRYPELVSGHAAPADVFVLFVWVALALVPIFQEINLFGIKLKQEIKKLEAELGSQIASLRAEVNNAVNVRTNISPHFNIPPPPSDAYLPELEQRVQAAVEAAIQAQGFQPPPVAQAAAEVDENTVFLFQARYNIERELRRIWTNRFGGAESRRPMVSEITRALTTAELLDLQLARAIRDVYSVCSPAIHGEEPSEAQLSFVRDVLPNLLTALRSIR
jgi:hypothetical protein